MCITNTAAISQGCKQGGRCSAMRVWQHLDEQSFADTFQTVPAVWTGRVSTLSSAAAAVNPHAPQ